MRSIVIKRILEEKQEELDYDESDLEEAFEEVKFPTSSLDYNNSYNSF